MSVPLHARETLKPVIEVFTDSSAVAKFDLERFKQAGIEGQGPFLYVIDRIDRLQQALSRDLPNDPVGAKQVVLMRFQGMDDQLSQSLENAATGLLKAKTYGIDRYPAIVLDARVVVYGITDIDEAIQHYAQWRKRGDS